MSATALSVSEVRIAGAEASELPWIQAGGVQLKVLAVDEGRKSVELLVKFEPGWNSGLHRHTCETYLFVVEGSVTNKTTGVEFGPGDFCYQPYGDEHVEEIGPEGAVILESLRGDDAGTVIEYLGESGTVAGKATFADFGQLLAQ